LLVFFDETINLISICYNGFLTARGKMMTYKLVVQNPANPKKTHKTAFNSLDQALQAGQSLNDHLLKEMMNRDIPLMHITSKEHGNISVGSNGLWWYSTKMDDGRIVYDENKPANFKVTTDQSIGKTLAETMPEWVFSWSYFLR
jgi:hypothetical protein